MEKMKNLDPKDAEILRHIYLYDEISPHQGIIAESVGVNRSLIVLILLIVVLIGVW